MDGQSPGLSLYNTQITAFFAEDKVDREDYCQGTRAWDWDGGKAYPGEPGHYEQTLDEFLAFDPGKSSTGKMGLLVLVGGIGTGKSTAVHEAWNRLSRSSRSCSLAPLKETCGITPHLINLDLRAIYAEYSKPGKRESLAEVQASAFWNAVATRFESLLPRQITFAEECRFWDWCRKQELICDRSEAFHRWLSSNQHQIRAVVDDEPYGGWTKTDILHFLERSRADIFKFQPEDIAWYRIFEFLYSREITPRSDCRCVYVFLDNVDQLEPDVQRAAVNFVTLLTPIVRARAIIAIRPLTWERSFDAHELIRAEDHFAPSFHDVLTRRLERLAASGQLPLSALESLRHLIEQFTTAGKESLWLDMFEATAGLSVRFALRNFTNFTQSPLLPPLAETSHPLRTMPASVIARGFFFGNSDSLITHAFENIYRIGRDSRVGYRLVKIRILHYVMRTENGGTTKTRLTGVMQLFGYDPNLVHKALNDLLIRQRPLLWCDDGHDAFRFPDTARIAITPIGAGYVQNLFGQLYYDEVCIAKNLRARPEPDAILEFHKELWEQDAIEVRRAVRGRAGLLTYLQLYPLEEPSISYIHARNLRVGFEKRKTQLPIGFDAKRVEFIRAEVLKLLGVEEEDGV
jgi:hypothetical protein